MAKSSICLVLKKLGRKRVGERDWGHSRKRTTAYHGKQEISKENLPCSAASQTHRQQMGQAMQDVQGIH